MKNGLRAIAASFGFFVLYGVVTNLYGLGMRLFFSLTHGELKSADSAAYSEQFTAFVEANIMSRAFIQFLLFIAVLLILFRIKKISLLPYIRWNPVSRQGYVSVAIMAVSFCVAFNILFGFFMPEMFQASENYSAAMTSGGLLFNIVLVVLIGPFTEELLLRGLMTSRMLGQLPSWFVVAASALIFGLNHADAGMGRLAGAVVYTSFGLVYTLIFVWTNSLRTSTLAHMLNNLFAAFLPWNTIISATPPLVQLIAGIVILSLAIYAACALYKRRDKDVVTVLLSKANHMEA
jgi:membrane protease YdiL (CAAX protease family)